MGKFSIEKFLMQEMYKKGWRSTTLVLRKPSGEEQAKFFDLECVNCGIMRGWKNTVKLGG